MSPHMLPPLSRLLSLMPPAPLSLPPSPWFLPPLPPLSPLSHPYSSLLSQVKYHLLDEALLPWKLCLGSLSFTYSPQAASPPQQWSCLIDFSAVRRPGGSWFCFTFLSHYYSGEPQKKNLFTFVSLGFHIPPGHNIAHPPIIITMMTNIYWMLNMCLTLFLALQWVTEWINDKFLSHQPQRGHGLTGTKDRYTG